MSLRTEYFRFILGLKLRRLRQERGYSLKETARRGGLSISYLSEIEKGKKYPKPDRLLDLARALEVPFDELVSLQVDAELDVLKHALSSPLIQEFPFELFGLEAEDLFGLVTDDPYKAGALVQTFLEIGQLYDVQVEHFLFAALRSYQQMHRNYFADLEAEAAAFRAHPHGLDGAAATEERLRALLEHRYGYTIDEDTLPDHPALGGFRSVFRAEPTPRLYVNGRLMSPQKAFIYGRELGFVQLGLHQRPSTSSWIQATSFEQVLNNFNASYFSGALLIDQHALCADLRAFLTRPAWDGEAFLALMHRYQATPEMFFYRLAELMPAQFGLDELFFMRLQHETGTDRFELTKVLNMSRVPVPHGIGQREHYCRRWPGIRLLRDLDRRRGSEPRNGTRPPAIRAQRSYFLNEDAEFFTFSMARPLALARNTHSCVSLGFLMNDAFKQTVRFWDAPAIPRADVNLSCERCLLAPAACHDRAAPPGIYEAQQAQARQEQALAALLAGEDVAAPER